MGCIIDIYQLLIIRKNIGKIIAKIFGGFNYFL